MAKSPCSAKTTLHSKALYSACLKELHIVWVLSQEYGTLTSIPESI